MRKQIIEKTKNKSLRRKRVDEWKIYKELGPRNAQCLTLDAFYRMKLYT